MASRAWKPGQFCWRVAEVFDGAAHLAGHLKTSVLVAQTLHNRGIDQVEDAQAFMAPKLNDMRDPCELPGAIAAAERIVRAIKRGERIVIYGDYDVDGTTAVAIMHACLTMLGANVDYYVPHRLEEGYGVNAEAMDKIISAGAQLIVTVDCGIRAAKQLRRATEAGVSVIVTDHHKVSGELPAAAAIVHPDL
ncbi:MAG: DHH family phosphoesterase, partial [Planctomycetes bacterium]|nr:DHH family phosphoesterase [Planctomycetota bacterium]